ncbi:hypothetical protein PWT90_06888 [Aphanocladium album]|nr:hypothetical protein PWT90_06888 [Aphanocladium album]
MDISVASQQVDIPWNDLRGWFHHAESTHLNTGSTDHITPAQRLALSCIVPFVQEPEMPSGDFVSELHRLLQRRQLPMPKFTAESCDVPVMGAFTKRWRCTCWLPRCDQHFPASGDGDTLLFANQKGAKQFAAMKALEHLSGRDTQLSLTHSSPAAQPRRVRPSSPHADETAQDKTRNSAGLHNENTVLHVEISRLASRLGLPQPKLSVEQDPDQTNFFNGKVEFDSRDTSRVPQEPLLVTKVLGEEQAKRKIGEAVLRWMQEEDARQQDTLISILAM